MYSEHGWSSLEGDRVRAAEEQARQVAARRVQDEEEQRRQQYQVQQVRNQQSAPSYTQSSYSGGSGLSGGDIRNLIMLPLILVMVPLEFVMGVIGSIWYRLSSRLFG